MITETKKVLALAALVVATGVATVELSRSSAQAEPVVMTRAGAYAAARVDTAFDLVSAMPVADFTLPMAQKGDLPVPLGCLGIKGDAQSECMDVAYELDAEPSIVVETRVGSTSTLMRMDSMTVAGVNDNDPLQQSE
jgi:hypothetical protein